MKIDKFLNVLNIIIENINDVYIVLWIELVVLFLFNMNNYFKVVLYFIKKRNYNWSS